MSKKEQPYVDETKGNNGVDTNKGTPDKKNGSNGNGKKKGGKKQGGERPPREDAPKRKLGVNDPSMYNANPQLAADAAKINFFTQLGRPLDELSNAAFEATGIPGAMALHYVPTFGKAVGPTDPINQAARLVAAYVKSKASNSLKTYDYPDLMIYLMAYDSILSYISYLKRIYGLLGQYNPLDLYMPRAIVRSMDVDYDDVIEHVADFRAGINILINELTKFVAPAVFPIFVRHMIMNETLYKDEESSFKPQLYYFVPDYLWKMALDDDGAGCLIPVEIAASETANFKGYQELLDIGKDMIDSLYEFTKGADISADLMRAYPPKDMVMARELPEAYTTVVHYDENMANAIQNATLVGKLMNISTSPAGLFQDTSKGYLTFDPCFGQYTYDASFGEPGPTGPYQTVGTGYLSGNKLVNFFKADISAAEQIEATCFTNSLDTSHNHTNIVTAQTATVTYHLTGMGTEVLTDASIICSRRETDGTIGFTILDGLTTELCYVIQHRSGDTLTYETMLDVFTRTVRTIPFLSSFTRHPYIAFSGAIVGAFNQDTSYVPSVGVIGTKDVYGVATVRVIDNMHRVAMLNMYNVAKPMTIELGN